MRDYLTPGQVEEIVNNSKPGFTQFSNGFLALYAKDIADRLRG